jgi:hypothetical protein
VSGTWQRIPGALASSGRDELGENLPLRLARKPSERRPPLDRFDAAARPRTWHQCAA